MSIGRRGFIKAAAAFVAAAPAIIRPSEGQILQFSGKSTALPPGTTIPMSLSDPRFSGNVNGPAGPFTTGTQSNKKWNDNPGYASGAQCWEWDGNASDVFSVSQSWMDWREGPRIGAGSTPTPVMNLDQCFINCVGKGADHADGIQAYSPGGIATINLTNSCLRSYSDAEAVAVYGAGFTGSDAFFWADSFQGSVVFNNVLIWGGARGVSIYADVGTTHVSFTNVFFASSPNNAGWDFYDYDIRSTGGSLVVDTWTNVRAATVVGGVIIPGSSLPSP